MHQATCSGRGAPAAPRPAGLARQHVAPCGRAQRWGCPPARRVQRCRVAQPSPTLRAAPDYDVRPRAPPLRATTSRLRARRGLRCGPGAARSARSRPGRSCAAWAQRAEGRGCAPRRRPRTTTGSLSCPRLVLRTASRTAWRTAQGRRAPRRGARWRSRWRAPRRTPKQWTCWCCTSRRSCTGRPTWRAPGCAYAAAPARLRLASGAAGRQGARVSHGLPRGPAPSAERRGQCLCLPVRGARQRALVGAGGRAHADR